MPINITARQSSIINFLMCLLFLGLAFMVGFWQNLQPCPLCILQRLAMGILAAIFLLAALHNPGRIGKYIYNIMALIVATSGIALAGRQLFLQMPTHNNPTTCTADLNYIASILPNNQELKTIFTTASSCEEVIKFLDLSMPAWTMGAFAILMLLIIWQILRNNRDN